MSRTIYSPHVEEQPHTRSLSNVTILDNVDTETVRTNDLIHKTGGGEMKVTLPL